VVVFAGPNGAGKTTHAENVLQTLGISTFVNADFIARGLSGTRSSSADFEAGRIMLKRLRQLGDMKTDFAFESTLSSRSFAPFLSRMKANGYRIAIYYFSLRSPSLAVRRVKMRVKLGGHDVPEADVRRRFERSLFNFMTLYMPLADSWHLFDNSRSASVRLIATSSHGEQTIKDEKSWQSLRELTNRR
jgi:predicted ABC-type ATPase